MVWRTSCAVGALLLLLASVTVARGDAPPPDAGAPAAAPRRSRAVGAVHEICAKRSSGAGRASGNTSPSKVAGFKVIAEGGTTAERGELAAAIASAVGQRVERISLGTIIGKYIGETEKNLNTLLARAETLDVVLLLDESDALFGKRAETADAGARDANADASYVLERLRNHEGVVVFGHAALDEKHRSRVARHVHRIVSADTRDGALWKALCTST